MCSACPNKPPGRRNTSAYDVPVTPCAFPLAVEAVDGRPLGEGRITHISKSLRLQVSPGSSFATSLSPGKTCTSRAGMKHAADISRSPRKPPTQRHALCMLRLHHLRTPSRVPRPDRSLQQNTGHLTATTPAQQLRPRTSTRVHSAQRENLPTVTARDSGHESLH
ncbi:uncharacterized protein LOC125145182, partial [Tachysurus ichikawai]